jgi:hypothetical protein
VQRQEVQEVLHEPGEMTGRRFQNGDSNNTGNAISKTISGEKSQVAGTSGIIRVARLPLFKVPRIAPNGPRSVPGQDDPDATKSDPKAFGETLFCSQFLHPPTL